MVASSMPLVFIHKGVRFFFFSNEGDPREPVHIHVRKDKKIAKFWIGDQTQLAESFGFSSKELNMLAKMVDNRRKEILEAWDDPFKS